MTGIRGLLVLAGLVVGAADLRAQVLAVPNPYLGTAGTGIFYSSRSHHGRLSLALGAGYGGFYGYWSPYYAAPYGYSVINQVTVITPPPFAPPVPLPFLGGPGRVLRLDDLADLDPSLRTEAPPVADRGQQPPDADRDKQLPGGREAGGFRPLAPDNRDRAARPLPPPRPPEQKPGAQPPAAPAPPAELPRPVRPDADPKVEFEQQLKLGREAFAAREYGRAIQFFRAAAQRAPDNAQPYALLGQALFAAGRYPEAVEAIRAAVGIRPDWPMARFAPRELYGPNVAEWTDHLQRLHDALNLLPDDSVLLFLYAYELWFDGHQADARPLLLKARARTADPAVIDRFLAARPDL